MTDDAATINLRITVTGHVQGVGYRAWFRAEAERMGVCGWVRNRRDGSVEAEVYGRTGMLERLLSRAAEGPALANVTSVESAPAGPSESLTGVEIRPTA